MRADSSSGPRIRNSVGQVWLSRLTLPAYTVSEVARLVQVHRDTVTRWYSPRGGSGDSPRRRVLESRQPRRPLSYLDLIEAAMVAALRRAKVSLRNIRAAHAYLKRRLKVDHPFARTVLLSDGHRVLRELEARGSAEWVKDFLEETSASGQITWSPPFAHLLRRFWFDEGLGIAVRWYPFGPECPVMVDPRIAFGTPVLTDSRVPTWIIRDRRKAGESARTIAADFEIDEGSVRAALAFEERLESRRAA